MSFEVGRLLGFEQESEGFAGMVSCSIEYSYERLPHVELEPQTVDDFEIIEQNSS